MKDFRTIIHLFTEYPVLTADNFYSVDPSPEI